MDDILSLLVQEIERGSCPCFSEKSEYQQSQYFASLHRKWLEGHLDEEAMAHFEKMQDAEIYIDTLRCEALIKMAIAIGIRLAVPT